MAKAYVNMENILHSMIALFFVRFAYVEFADKDSVITAMALDDSLFRGRQIKVSLSLNRW